VSEYSLTWLVLVPALFAALAPFVAAFAARLRAVDVYYPIAHLASLAAAIFALRTPAATLALGLSGAPASTQILLTFNRPVAAELSGVALLFLILAMFGRGLVRETRLGRAFLTLLLWLQTAIAVVLVSGDLFALYLGLLLLSLSLVLLIGLDFGAPGGSAALRVFATLEVPAAVALAGLWVVDARAETVAVTDLAQKAAWLARPESLALSLPIAIALLSRAGLVPFQQWVVVGCRAAAAPVAIAIAALAVPTGAIVMARLIASLPLDPSWLLALGVLATATALLASFAALRERTARGWLADIAVAQVALAIVSFAKNDVAASATGWVLLGSGALTALAVGLGLAVATRVAGSDDVRGAGPRVVGWIPAATLALGYLAIGAVPPFASFGARQLLVGRLMNGAATFPDVLCGLGVLLATAALGASVWRRLTAPGLVTFDGPHDEPMPSSPVLVATSVSSQRTPQRARAPVLPRPGPAEADRPRLAGTSLAALVMASALLLVSGEIPSKELANLIGVAWPGELVTTNTRASALVGAALLFGLGWEYARSRLARWSDRWNDWLRPVIALQRRYELTRIGDPYLVAGWLLLTLGRVSAALIDNTLGRLVRAS
jgi:formate hydrogenlyase subunit 3/multisubunit Na+/H+ antiporter MnhD subunit